MNAYYTYNMDHLSIERKKKCFRANKANIHIMVLGLLVDVLDFARGALLGASVVNAYIFTANNSSGNPF